MSERVECIGYEDSRYYDRRGEHPLYFRWRGMIKRCHSPGSDAYANYGHRGIVVCQRWREDFWAFVADVGTPPSPHHTLERIDNDGPYEPGNVRWATYLEQRNNTRFNRVLELNGRRQTVSQWAREMGVSRGLILGRLQHGWSIEDAILLPSQRWPRRAERKAGLAQ